MIPLFKVMMSAADALERLGAVLHSGRLEHGPVAEEFEAALARRIGNPRALALNSGTSGLHLAVSLAARPARPGEPGQPAGAARPAGPDERPGGTGEVLSTPFTFEGTNWPILANGLRIRWVDVDPATLNIDLDDLARKISPATRAVMLVHWAGYPVDLDRLRAVLDRAAATHGVRPLVIEDCAQAWGATYRGVPLGNHGNACVFSFGALKPLTCGSGGLLVLPDDELYARARSRRWFGIDRQADRRNADYDVADWGYRFYLNDVSAAIGLANLEVVDGLLKRNRDNAAYYDDELAGVPGVELTERAADREPSFWTYPLKVADRPAFMRALAAAGIMSSLISRRNDAHGCVAALRGPLPGLDGVYDRLVHIPVGWWVSEEDRAHIVRTIKTGW